MARLLILSTRQEARSVSAQPGMEDRAEVMLHLLPKFRALEICFTEFHHFPDGEEKDLS